MDKRKKNLASYLGVGIREKGGACRYGQQVARKLPSTDKNAK
jgi:hypothetical protein